MASKLVDKTKNMLDSIGAIQTLVENFPMNLISFGNMKFSTSFDVLTVLFKILGVDREELIECVTNALCGSMKETSDGSGFVSQAEEIVKIALETNLINIFNCSTNPIISNNLLDSYEYLGTPQSGEGVVFDVSEIDFTGVLNRSPFYENGSKFYFDVEDKTPQDLYKSKDFNAFLWYIINRSDKSQDKERIWDNRYRAAIHGKGNGEDKEIIRCTYIDDEYPNNDKIKVHLCGSEYFKTRELSKKGGDGTPWKLNKTIFEFNHDFLTSIKLYEPKVIISEIVEYLLGTGNFTANLGFSVNDEIIEGKIQEIIKKVISADDTVISDCYFTFSNDEYNEMLEKSESKRYNMLYTSDGYVNTNPDEILNNLTAITTTSELVQDKTVIKNTLNDLIVKPAQDAYGEVKYGIEYDWQFELMRMLVYPFVRPIFTPKVIFLLLLNKKIMGSLEDYDNVDLNLIIEDLMGGLFNIIKDIIIKLKDLLVELFLNLILDKLKPLLELFVSRLLLETLRAYKDLLTQLLESCSFGWGANKLVGVIDNVNYADITPVQTEPGQNIC